MSPLRRARRPDPSTFAILVVCTGNICRSPIAERLLRTGLDARLAPEEAARVTVSSAGTGARAGWPMDAGSADALSRLGVAPGTFRSQPLSRGLLDRADLVLTATRGHRTAVGRLRSDALARTLPLRHAGRLLAAYPPPPLPPRLPERGRALAMHLLAQAAGDAAGVEDDLGDPIGRPAAAFVRCADEIALAVHPLVDALVAGAPYDAPRLQ